jgi:hypothetical protein
MHRLLYRALLLAQGGGLEDFARGLKGRRFRFDTENIASALLIVAGMAIAVWILSYLLRLQERRRGYASPLRLFLSLCKAHRLRWSQRWLLWRVARAEQLRDPACLFLEPERLEAAHLGPAFAGRQPQLNQIRHRLFDQLELPEEHQHSQVPTASNRQLTGAPVSPTPPPSALDATFQTAPLVPNADATTDRSL